MFKQKNILRFALSLLAILPCFASSAPVIERLTPAQAKLVILNWQDFDAQALCGVAGSTRDYLRKGEVYDPHANHAGVFAGFGITTMQVEKTLDFICQTVNEDRQSGEQSRLEEKEYLTRHFDFYRWQPDMVQVARFSKDKRLLENLPADKILLTKYYVKEAQGSRSATADKPYALYALPYDEAELTLEQADRQKAKLTRYRFTKGDVLTGILEQQKLATPLVYLSRTDLEDALMQGTVRVVFADGEAKVFNVHRNNGHHYDRAINKEAQKRYWYFKQVDSVKGYGKDADFKISIAPRVTVAGDLALWGLGKLVLLNDDRNSRLAILADTGGAFEGNAYQLDYLAGYYSGWKDYYQAWKNKPDYYQAYFLILK